MKKHITYLVALIILFGCLVYYISNSEYLLNESLFLSSLTAMDLDGDFDGESKISPITKDSLYHNIFHIKLKNNNIQNILGKFLVFSESHLNLDFNQEYILISDPYGKVTDSVHWGYKDFVIQKIIPDLEGNLYIQASIFDKYNAWILEDAIFKYSVSNKKILKITDYQYKEDKPFMSSAIRDLQIADEGVVYYFYSISDQTLKQYKHHEVEELLFETKVPEEMTLINIFGTEPGNIMYTTRENKVGQLNKNLEFVNVKEYLAEKTSIDTVDYLESELYVLTQEGKLDRYQIMNGELQFERLSSMREKSAALFSERKEIFEGFRTLKFSNQLILKKWWLYGLALLTFAVLIYTIRFIYIYILQRKMWISLKLIFVLVPAVSITVLIFTLFTMINMFADVNDDIKEGKHIQFDKIINYQFERIGKDYDEDYLADFLESFNPYEEIDAKSYETFEGALSLQNIENDQGPLKDSDIEDIGGMYLVVDVVKNGVSYKILDTENNYRWFTKRSPDNALFKEPIKGQTVHSSTRDYIFTLKPIFNNEGKVVGILQVGMNYSGYKKESDERLLSKIGKSVLIIPSIMLPLIIFITYILLMPIGKFTKIVKSINDENLDTDIEMNTHDEIEDLSDAFNTMTTNMYNFINDIKKMSLSYHRFVPQEIFSLLKKEKVEDIQLGDNIKLDMTILCAGINNFYEITEKLGHEESFNLINQHLKVIGPIIRKHNGVIDRYLDIGVVAMFPESADDAVKSAVEIQKTIEELKDSESENYKNIDIAIHKGDMIIGIIGEAKRLQSNMVSDIVNVCLLLQSKASLLSSRILISQEAFESLEEDYDNRKLGSIKLTGREESLDLIDIFQGDQKESYELKNKNNEIFSFAVESYVKGKYEVARSNFVRVLEKNINDRVARLYFYEVDKKMNEESQESVDGENKHPLVI